jgi:hypothetical protein
MQQSADKTQLVTPLTVVRAEEGFAVKKVFPLLQTSLLKKIVGNTLPAAYHIFEKLDRLVAANGEGDLPEELRRSFYQTEITGFPTMLQLHFAISTYWGEGSTYKIFEFMNKEFMPEIKKFYGFDLCPLKVALGKLPHFEAISRIIMQMEEENRDAAYAAALSRNILAAFIPLLDKANTRKIYAAKTSAKEELQTVFISQHSCIRYWMSNPFGYKETPEAFVKYFTPRYIFYRKSDYLTTRPPVAINTSPLSVFDFGYAFELGLISQEEMWQELLTRVNAGKSLNLASALLCGTLTPRHRDQLKAYGSTDFARLKEITGKVSAHIIEVELRQNDPPTEISHLATKLERIEGAPLWIEILKAFGTEPFERMDNYHSPAYTRKEALNILICICHPAEADTAETLPSLLKGSGVAHERLVEAAVYAPQWLEIIENHTGWKGLRNAALFFHAHISERCSNEMEALIARFTSIPRKSLLSGGFDVDWYRQAAKEIGAARFNKVYQASRCVSSAVAHARLGKAMNFANGEKNATETKQELSATRNRGLLMRYALIPLSKQSNHGLITRYLYIQQFLKESKAFGSQRQESEKQAVELAMLNLTRNAGYNNVTRLVWNVETALLKNLKPYFTPYESDGVKVYLKVDDTGRSCIRYIKAGRALTNIPDRLRKDPHVSGMRETVKRLKSLYAPSARMLEEAMEEQTPFLASELSAFLTNPFVSPLIKPLLFITPEGITGFYTADGLLTDQGEIIPQAPETPLCIAHPVDLPRHHAKTAKQPFEQVARKTYYKTETEQTATASLRHAGKHIRPDKTDAMLKEHRWASVDEEKWQKVYYKEDVAVVVETLSHALSPTDAGVFTLERIVFFERKSNRPLPIADVPDRVFSEVMHDVKLLFL